MNADMKMQTRTSARKESGLFADMILHARQATNSTQADMMHRETAEDHLVPNILLTGALVVFVGLVSLPGENTGNTYYQRLTPVDLRTDAGGEGLSARARERSLLLSRIESFATLPKDWGGEDTILAGRQTLDVAKRLVRELPRKWPLPQATASPEGEIAFTWFKGGNRLEALLQPDQHLIWVVKHDDGQYAPGRDIDLAALASFAGLFEAIARFYT